MAVPKTHKDVLFFCGILANSVEGVNIAEVALLKIFEKITLQSLLYKHEYTKYYEQEMGNVLYRKFLGFLPLRQPTELKDLKLATNNLEVEVASKLHSEFPRPVNFDPGYVDEPRVVLASCKDYNHRIAIGDGVYADLHLVYTRKSGFEGLPWSYPDYTDAVAKDFFLQCRQLLRSSRGNYENKED